jgi:choline dehydrogenase-like flavoprotein
MALYAFDTMTEQVPTPRSRVQLSRNVDALGVRKVALDWRITPFDQENLWRAYEVVADAFGAAGLGRVRLLRDRMDVIWGKQLSWGHHHIGTTRMSDSPRTGVTDANCRVHSLANLFIGGSSVFPTGGHVPPTLTIVALANRLADHLKRVAAH